MGRGVVECLFFRVPFLVASPPPHPRDITAFFFGLNYKSPRSARVFSISSTISEPNVAVLVARIESTAATGQVGQRAILERTMAEIVLAHYYSTDRGLFAYLFSSHPRSRSFG